jgi:hypothetical protein
MSDIITCKEARARGLPRYFTGEPCKHGHLSERYTMGSGCVMCLGNGKPRQRRMPSAPKRLRTAELNRLHNEANARRRREREGAAKRRGLIGLGTAMASEDARERSNYLDNMILAGKNFIR